MEYIFNTKTNCFEGYEPQYETKIDETTGEEKQELIPCTERLYTQEEVDSFLFACVGNKTLKAVDGVPTIVDRLTESELAKIIAKKRIAELKAKLTDTDYLAIKVLEGAMSVEEYEGMRLTRQAWREEINALEEVAK